jgi:hypothetical protein
MRQRVPFELAQETRGQLGVALLVHKDIHGLIEEVRPINSRIILLKQATTPDMIWISCYAPQSGHDLEYKTKFYGQLKNAIEDMKKGCHSQVCMIGGDFNARLGLARQVDSKCCGHFIKGLRETEHTEPCIIDNAELMAEFLKENRLYVIGSQNAKLQE